MIGMGGGATSLQQNAGGVAVSFYGDRGITAGGNGPSNVIQYYDITSTGNATDFGVLLEARYDLSPSSDGSRGIFSGGANPSVTDTISYVTIASTGNATDFGNLPSARHGQSQGTISDGTTGIWGGGDTGSVTNQICSITIQTTGNASDFGDLNSSHRYFGACCSLTRGVFGGAYNSSPCVAGCNYIDYITIASPGNATDFGDLTDSVYRNQGCSSETRGIFGGGQSPRTNVIEYITIATPGNATDFGDLNRAIDTGSATSNNTRGIFSGGNANVGATEDIQYVTIANTGNATDFGDLLSGRQQLTSCSGN